MFDRFPKYKQPATVDDAAEILISDLTTQQMTAMAEMDDKEFDLLYDQLIPYLQHDFRLWRGNDSLLSDCFRNMDGNSSTDPMRIIMDCVRAKLRMLNDVIITV